MASLLIYNLCIMLTIYTCDGLTRFETPINKGSKRTFQLMGDDCVTLKFSVSQPVPFRLGDYVDIPNFGRFELVTPYRPTLNSATNGYDYELRLDAQYIKWRNKVMRYSPKSGSAECSWVLTATADVHLKIVLDNVNAMAEQVLMDGTKLLSPNFLYNGTSPWAISLDSSVPASAKTVSYESTNIIDALTAIAEAFECEWWVNGNIICLGKCESTNDLIDLEIGKNVAEMTRSDSSEDFVTRILVFGGERNVSPRYRKDLIFDVKKTRDGGDYIQDTNRPLDADWFASSLVTVLNTDNNVKSISGIALEVINSNGEVEATINGAIYNPELRSTLSERNWIKLPPGFSMQVGQRFRIRNINENKVKSSYFSSRYSAYDDYQNTIRNGIVKKRLMLPVSHGTPYVDYKPGLSMEEGVEDVVVFEDIYPRAVCTITGISTVQRDETVQNDDGTETKASFTAYQIKDDFFTSSRPFRDEYMVPNETLKIVFQDGKRYVKGDTIPEGKKIGDLVNPDSGKLNGWTFEVKFSKGGDGSAIWEINRDNENYIPNEILCPEIGDQFILTGFDIAMVDDLYVEKAENELLKKANEYLEKLNTDPSTYECTMMPDAIKPGVALTLGTRVNLINDSFIEPSTDADGRKWGRISRVIGFEIPLDIPYDNPVYIIGEKAAYSRFGEISDNINALKYSLSSIENSYSSSTYVIKQIDSTPASDTTVFSSLRSYLEFTSKKAAEIIKHLWTFAKGLQVGNYVEGVSGAAIDAEGNVEAKSAVIREAIKAESATFEQVGSRDFSDGLTGNGYRIDKVGQDWRLTLDRLTVRKAMTVFEMLVEKVRAVGGRVIVSAANGIVDTVTETGDSYILTFKGSGSGVTHTFQLGDLVRCQMYNGTPKYYWVEVIGVSNDSITVAKSDFNGVVPAEGDELVLMGNVIDSRRQGCISISASEGGKPCIEVFDGISTTSTDRCLKARLGDLSGITSDSLPLDRQPNGYGLFSDNVYLKGAFVLANGTDVATLFEVMNGKLTSQITGLRDYGNLLQNACFDSDLTEWHYEDSIKPFMASNLWLTTGGNFVTVKDTFARIAEDTSLTTPRKVLRIRNSFVMQSNGNMLQQPPRHEVDAAGLRQAHSHSLTFCYKVTKPGRLTVEFKGASKDGYADFDMLGVDTELGVTEDYLTFEALGLWNGTGDFHMAFTGEIYVHSLRLTPDRAADVGNKLQTRIEQTAESIKAQARQLGETTERLTTVELNADGINSTVANLGESMSQIQQTANTIKMSVQNLSDGLKDTGINISDGTIVISSDNVHFIDNAGQQQMLLKDGKLNTKVLSTDRLEVVANGKKAVTITPEDEGMKVYDKATGNVCQEFSGMSASNGIGQFFDEENSGVLSLINTSGSATPPPNSDDCNQSVEVSLSSGAKYVASPSYITLTDGMLYTEATAGTIYVDAPYKDYMSINIGTDRRLDDISLGEEATTMAEISIIARCFTDAQCGTRIGGDITIATIKAEATAAYQTTERRDTATVRHVFSCDITDRKNLYCATMGCRIPSAGFIRLYLVHHFITPRLPNYASWGTPRSAKAMWGAQVGVGVKPLAAEYSSEGFISRYFANGFCLASRNDDYVLAYKGDRGMHFESRNANYGLRCTPDGLQTLVCSSPTESRWMPLPVLLFHGSISYIGGAYSVSDTDCVCFDPEMPTLSRLGAGYVRVWFPSSWKTRLGDRLNPDRLSLNVVAQNSAQAIAACVGDIGAASFTIRMSADSSFFIELKLL